MTRVLVIDDDIQIRNMLREFLTRNGYDAVVAGDGSAATELLREGLVDLVITDVVMPNKEGLETIREIRADHPDMKIIAISGGGKIGPQSYLDLARRFGAVYTFTKPLDLAAVMEAVRDLTGVGRS